MLLCVLKWVGDPSERSRASFPPCRLARRVVSALDPRSMLSWAYFNGVFVLRVRRFERCVSEPSAQQTHFETK